VHPGKSSAPWSDFALEASDTGKDSGAAWGEAKASERWLGAGADGVETRPSDGGVGAWKHSVVKAEVEDTNAEVQEELRSELGIATPRARLAPARSHRVMEMAGSGRPWSKYLLCLTIGEKAIKILFNSI
jgi:hypothetical protein